MLLELFRPVSEDVKETRVVPVGAELLDADFE